MAFWLEVFSKRDATSRVSTLVAENAAKIETAAARVAHTENAVIKVATKAGEVVELGSGKLITTDIGSHLVLSTVIDSRIQHIQAIDKVTATVSILVAVTAGAVPKDKSECEVCNERAKDDAALCTLLKAVQGKATDSIKAKAALEKLCQVPFTQLSNLQLKGIAEKLLTLDTPKLDAFFTEITETTTDTDALSQNLGQLNAENARCVDESPVID